MLVTDPPPVTQNSVLEWVGYKDAEVEGKKPIPLSIALLNYVPMTP